MKITTIHAYIATDEDGGEGIVGIKTADGWIPMIGADQERIDQLRPVAVKIATAKGINITLSRFTVREDVEVLHGKAEEKRSREH